MKLIDLLKEIGEGSKEPYQYTRKSNHNNEAQFYWKTEEGTEYHMVIDKLYYDRPEIDSYNVAFGIAGDKNDRTSIDFTSTNKDTKTGNLYRIMSTVVDIINKEIARDKENRKRFPKTIEFVTLDGDSRRIKLFTAYLKKALPNAKVYERGAIVYMDLQ